MAHSATTVLLSGGWQCCSGVGENSPLERVVVVGSGGRRGLLEREREALGVTG